jgi:hypothetical protein
MITVSVQPTIFSDILTSMQIGNEPWSAPRGLFYQVQGNIVPFTPQPTVLRIETDRVGEAINIRLEKSDLVGAGVDVRDNEDSYTVVAASQVVTTGIQLGRGENRITVTVAGRPDERAFLIVRATSIVSFWESFARVIFQDAFKIIDEQQRAISSKLATRLLEPVIPFGDLLPDIQSLQILATRLASKGLIHSVGSQLGVTDLIKSLSLTTPVYRNIDKDTDDLWPSLDPWVPVASQFGGQEAHVWIPNVGITSWLAFLHFIANQPDIYEIIKITEREVIVRYQGDIQRHLFDFDAFGTEFLTILSSSECFKSIIVTVSMDVEIGFSICAASYTFDLFVDADNLLGNCRRTFDINVPLDTDCNFDADPIDPFTDGWLNLSLTGRFEQDSPATHPLDTFVVPSSTYTGSVCGYEGYYTQMVSNAKYEIDLDLTGIPDVNGFIQSAVGWILESPDGTKWSVRVNATTGTLIASTITSGNLSNFKVTKPDSSEAAFAITNLGELQVVAPTPGGELLFDTIFILATDSTVWHVTVDNTNVLETTKIFPL